MTAAAAPTLRMAFEDPAEDRRRRVLVTLFGVEAPAIAPLMTPILASLSRGDLPIFVTTQLDVSPFRWRGVLFDYLPAAGTLRLPDAGRYERYVRGRHAVLLAKWAPASVIRLGATLDAFIAAAVTTGGTPH